MQHAERRIRQLDNEGRRFPKKSLPGRRRGLKEHDVQDSIEVKEHVNSHRMDGRVDSDKIGEIGTERGTEQNRPSRELRNTSSPGSTHVGAERAQESIIEIERGLDSNNVIIKPMAETNDDKFHAYDVGLSFKESSKMGGADRAQFAILSADHRNNQMEIKRNRDKIPEVIFSVVLTTLGIIDATLAALVLNGIKGKAIEIITIIVSIIIAFASGTKGAKVAKKYQSINRDLQTKAVLTSKIDYANYANDGVNINLNNRERVIRRCVREDRRIIFGPPCIGKSTLVQKYPEIFTDGDGLIEFPESAFWLNKNEQREVDRKWENAAREWLKDPSNDSKMILMTPVASLADRSAKWCSDEMTLSKNLLDRIRKVPGRVNPSLTRILECNNSLRSSDLPLISNPKKYASQFFMCKSECKLQWKSSVGLSDDNFELFDGHDDIDGITSQRNFDNVLLG